MLRTRVRAGPVAGLVLSVLFAALFTVIGVGDLYISALTASIGQATPVTLRIPYGPRIVRFGDQTLVYEHTRVIVPRGTVLMEDNHQHRAALAYASIRRPPNAGRLLSTYV